MCFYINSKIRSINKRIVTSLMNERQIKRIKISEILKELDSVYLEITEYNDNHWSKFLVLKYQRLRLNHGETRPISYPKALYLKKSSIIAGWFKGFPPQRREQASC